MEILRFIFSSFWVWLGFTILVYLPLDAIRLIIVRLIRRSIVSKHGWPPAHIDADGDWKPEQTKS